MCGKYRFLLVAATFCGVCLSFPVGAESLQEVLAVAVTDHPAIAAASAGHKGAEQEKGVEFSNYFPELSVSTTIGRIYQDNATSRGLDVTRGAAYSGYGEGNIALRQMLFDGLETRHRVGAADARMKSQEVSVEDAQEIVALQVASAYIEILRTHAALELLKMQREKISDYENRIKAMVDEGAADEAELQQARDVSMIIDGSIADYEGQILSAHAAYAQATGKPVADALDVPESSAALLLDDVSEAATLAKTEHPALRVAMLEADAAKEDVDVARAGYFPDLAGELSYAKTDKNDIIGGESVDGRAVVRMNWNFSTGGKQSAAVGQMKYKVAESKARLEEMKRQIERGVLSAYANLQTYRRKVGLSQDRVELNEKLFAAYQAQFEGARISLLGLMKAESQLFNAKLEKMDNDYNLLAAEYGVLASMGRLKSSLLKNEEK